MSARSKIVRDFSGQEVAIPYDPRDDAQHTPGPIDWSTVEAPRAIAATWSDSPRDLEADAAYAEIVRRWEAHEAMLEALLDITRWVDPDLDPLAGVILTKARAAIAAAEGRTDLGAAKHVHSFSIWHDRQDRPAHGYSRCACGVEPGDAWAEAK